MMDWFQRHLNWSLFFGTSLLPLVVNMVLWAIFIAVIGGELAAIIGSGAEEFSGDMMVSLFSKFLPFAVISGLVNLALFVFDLLVVWWYLGQKARSKWFMFLFVGPIILALIIHSSSFVVTLLMLLGALVCIIILYCLENRSIGYGGDFISEPATDYWRPDTGRFAGYDSEQLKELDYSPAKNVEDIAYGGAAKDVGDAGASSGEVPPPFPPEIPPEPPVEFSVEPVGEVPSGIPPPFPPEVPVETPQEVSAQVPPEEAPEATPQEVSAQVPPEEVPEETPQEVSAQVPSEVPEETPPEVSAQVPPELPEETPPEAPVEAAAETRAEVPPEPPVEFSVEAVDEVPPEAPAVTPTEAKVAEEPARPEALKMPILLDDAGAVIRCFYHPDADAVNLCSRCGQYVCSRCNYVTGTHPICRNCWERRGEAPVAGVAAGAGESVKPGKAEKLKPEEDERLREFMQLYEQAAPIVNNVIKREADGSPSPPLELMEGLKLRPILEQAQKLPKPDGKELQEAMKEFEQLLLSCIKVAEAAAGLVSAGEEAVPSEEDLTRLSMDIATANGLMQSLSQRLASLSQSLGD